MYEVTAAPVQMTYDDLEVIRGHLKDTRCMSCAVSCRRRCKLLAHSVDLSRSIITSLMVRYL